MSARAIGTATLSFGLVSIPVKVFTSHESAEDVSFNLLHKDCGARVKQQYICPKDNNAVVPRADMVKGYEFEKGKYVVFTNHELKAFEEEANRAIAINEFLPEKTVDPIYFEAAYYLGPGEGGERAYALLRAAMKQTGRVALAKYAARGKQYLVMVRPFGFGMVMQELHYAEEVKPVEEIPTGEAEIKPRELELAVQLIEQISSDEFKPKAYTDDVKKRIQAAIAQKIAGQEISAVITETPRAQIIDLMEALKASIQGEAQGQKPAVRAGDDQAEENKAEAK